MKYKLISFVLLLLFFFKIKSQITLESTYSNIDDEENFGIITLDNSGKKYFKYEDDNYLLKLYNLDHSLYKSINFDITSIIDTNIYMNSDLNQVTYISENLFDTDNEVEFLFSYFFYDNSGNNSVEGTVIFNEDGTIILNAPDYLLENNEINTGIENTSNGTKMILFHDNINNANVYNLPGRLTCSRPCSDSTITGKKISHNKSLASDFKAYPNPTKDYINIEYELPNGARKGDIVFYDFQGREIKRYTVDRTFDHLKLKTDDLSKGMYIFNLQTTKGVSQSKKILKIE